MNMHSCQVLRFWFADGMEKQWFRATPTLDREVGERFADMWRAAAEHRLSAWEDLPDGALALVIVLDQFPLNMFRGQARAYSTEAEAIRIARKSIKRGFDAVLPEVERAFLYMPLMHSENLEDQDESVRLFEAAGLQDNARFARHHRELISRFGRFPHRNAILGRDSTPAELAYLASKEAFTG